jgi:molybdate transport system ATP-binding protein
MAGERELTVRIIVDHDVPRSEQSQPRLDVDLVVTGGLTIVMGPSGAGKSTLLAAIAGLVVPRAGKIALNGRTLYCDQPPAFVPPHRRRIALLFQSLALFPHLRVWQNVAYGLPKATALAPREAAQEWLRKAKVAHLSDRLPPTLSGGEAQRVALARALANEPLALLLDEPFSALDRELRQELREDLVRFVGELQLPTLFVTHDDDEAAKIAAPIVRLKDGRQLASTQP